MNTLFMLMALHGQEDVQLDAFSQSIAIAHASFSDTLPSLSSTGSRNRPAVGYVDGQRYPTARLRSKGRILTPSP